MVRGAGPLPPTGKAPQALAASCSKPTSWTLVMVTVAEARLALSTSLTVTPESTTTGGPSSVKLVLPAVVVTTGASLTACTETALSPLLLFAAPSLTTKRTMRLGADVWVFEQLLGRSGRWRGWGGGRGEHAGGCRFCDARGEGDAAAGSSREHLGAAVLRVGDRHRAGSDVGGVDVGDGDAAVDDHRARLAPQTGGAAGGGAGGSLGG